MAPYFHMISLFMPKQRQPASILIKTSFLVLINSLAQVLLIYNFFYLFIFYLNGLICVMICHKLCFPYVYFQAGLCKLGGIT